MPKIAKALTQTEVDAITKTGLHAVGGVAGLQVQISGQAARSWILRTVTPSGKRRDFGLGSCSIMPLDKAREYAAALKHLYACEMLDTRIESVKETLLRDDGTIHPLLVEVPILPAIMADDDERLSKSPTLREIRNQQLR